MKTNSFFKKCSVILAMTVVTTVLFPLKACAKEPMHGGEPTEPDPVEKPIGVITMTATYHIAFFEVGIAADADNSVNISIDWGDGEMSEISDGRRSSETGRYAFSHSFSGNRSEHRITVTGNITSLNCHGCGITALDVSGNLWLTELYFHQNQLSELDVSKNVSLERLSVSSNRLTSLDVSNNLKLLTLGCEGNRLTSLDVSRNTALVSLGCGNNLLIELDLSRNTALKHLRCFRNQLSNLDVSNNTLLEELYVGRNKLVHLDLSNNIALIRLYCEYNQITNLDMSKNLDLVILLVAYNPFTVSAFNDMFRTMPNRKHSSDGTISISFREAGKEIGTPAIFECDRSIAEEKGWVFRSDLIQLF